MTFIFICLFSPQNLKVGFFILQAYKHSTGAAVSIPSLPSLGIEPPLSVFLLPSLLFALLMYRTPLSPPPSRACSCASLRRLFIFWALFGSFSSFARLLFGVFVSPCRRWADIILWKGNDPTVLRLCMCAAHCNGLTFYCLPHTNPTTEGMRRHLQGAVCELQPHMKEWPLKMIKEITILGCTTLLSCLARCSSPCPGVHEPWLMCTYARTRSHSKLR